MSKIICEVCGTAYPDTATQCPICGCVRTAGAKTVSGDTENSGEQKPRERTAVRGGRYSKANVRRRNATNQTTPPKKDQKPSGGKKNNGGLLVLVIVLLLAIAAMLVYVAYRFVGPLWKELQNGTETTTEAPLGDDATGGSDTTADSDPREVLCTDLKVSSSELELTAEGQAWLLNVKPVPEDTTQPITYASTNPDVVSVSAQGKVVAIAPGMAEITVTCGDVTKTCRVTVEYAEETDPTETTEEPTEAPTEPDEDFKLNREDITLAYAGEYWDLYKGGIAKPLITWTSDDESVATIENGRVVAVGSGTTKVHGEYKGQKATCIIRCSFTAGGDGEGFNTGVGEG